MFKVLVVSWMWDKKIDDVLYKLRKMLHTIYDNF